MPTGTDLRDRQWTGEIQKGNQAAFESLFRSYYSRLCRFAFRLTGSRTIAEELVQDIFVRLWNNRSTWIPTGSVRTYLYRSVRNQAINYQKHENLTPRAAGNLDERLSSAPSPEEQFFHKEMQTAVEEAIELLPPRCRHIFLLHRVEGLTYAEIAEVLDISVKTVETQIARALKTLRHLLIHHLPAFMSLFLFDSHLF